ncbi:MAG: sulfatase-like hydrolase/transferase, partial [Bacteroidota bacterium]
RHLGGGRDVDDAPAITEYGFDEYRSTWESPDPDPVLTSGNWIWKPEDSVKRWDRTAYFVDHTLRFLREHPDEPCFINLWPDDVHTPWVPYADEIDEKQDWFRLRNLPPVLSELDQQIGRLINELEEMGQLENTLIIFTSDNGPAPSFERLRANGLRGVKNSLYEGGINMPFFVHWPAQIKAGQVDSSSLLASIDLLPTLCRLTETALPSSHRLDGEDVSNTFLTGQTYRRQQPIFFEYGRNERYNYPKDSADRSLQLAVRSTKWKLYTTPDGSSVELYDLASDPKESQEVSASHPDLVQELKPLLIEWFEQNDQSLISREK